MTMERPIPDVQALRRRGMDGVREFLDDIQKRGLARGHLLGLLHILIGRRLAKADGTVISTGLTWRDVASEMKRCRWEPEAVSEIGVDPATLPPRDRQRFWYQAITAANVGSTEAAEAGDRLALILTKAGYIVGPAPRS
jgi:hypothetical protein